jgi:hypothetical protein
VKFAKQFVQKFAVLIVASLSCFDRVIFKGHLPFYDENRLNGYVDHVLKMPRKDFLPWLEKHSEALVQRAKELAQRAGRPYEYRQGRFKKERFIEEMIRKDRLSEGLVAVLCVQETCRTVKLKWAKQRPQLIFARRPQRVLYYYRLDAEFGLMHVRLQTWFPYTIQVYVNGHNWLERQMKKAGLGFVQHDNAFTALDDPQRAQKLADRFAKLPWVKQLARWAREVNPLLCGRGWLSGTDYYWVADQAEYATDILFASLPCYQEVARAANERYLDALSVVEDPAPAYQQVAQLAESKVSGGRRYAGFNPACRDDVRLFRAVLAGEHLLRGFRNAEIRRALWGDSKDARQRQRQANAVTRRLKRLHVRGLLAKIPRTRRWRVTAKGHKLLGAIIQLHYHGLSTAA